MREKKTPGRKHGGLLLPRGRMLFSGTAGAHAEFTRSHILPFPEGGAKAALAVEAAAERDFLDGDFGRLQQIFGGIQTGGDQVLMRRKSGPRTEDACKIVKA